MTIRKLPALLVNQIAAGEVIDRPASVVKELVENSLDAGATQIDVLIEDGGRRLMRVRDNGTGIAVDELTLAVAPHATSKLDTPEQLGAIQTLGFRGEALASIASVSRLRVTSRPTIAGSPSAAAAVIEASGDDVSEPSPRAAAPGTVIEVRDLFFNTPARRKFMRASGTEFGHIHDMVTRMAMVHHGVSFTLTHGSRKVLELSLTDEPRQRCIQLLGQELEEALLEFQSPPSRGAEERGVDEALVPTEQRSVWGLAGLPSIARATTKFQTLCLNGRPIRDRSLSHAVKEAYRGLIAPDRHPVVVVFLEMDPHLVDLNVHPTKAEVRFRDPNQAHGLVLTSLRQRLLGADLTPTVRVPDANSSSRQGTGFTQNAATHPAPEHRTLAGTDGFVDHFGRTDPVQKGFQYQQVRAKLTQQDAHVDGQPERQTPPLSEQAPHVQPPPSMRTTNPLGANVLQVHNSYIVSEDDQGIVIVDQHALHERVMFEELRSRVMGGDRKLQSQRLLMPIIIDATPKHQALVQELAPLLERLGIEAVPAGPKAIGIQSFPTFLFDRKVDPGSFTTDLLDRVEAGDVATATPTDSATLETVLHEVLDMMACKAAVRAGDRMTPEELEALLAKREQVERSSSCPHGRPTSIRLSLRELEKQFKRT